MQQWPGRLTVVLWQSESVFSDGKKKQQSEEAGEPDSLACWCSVSWEKKNLSWSHVFDW